MTHKRFTLIDMNNIEKVLPSPIRDDGSDCLCWFEVVECLNKLHEENLKLKEYVENLVNADAHWEKKARQRVKELETENKQLKKELDKLKVVNEMLSMDFAQSEHELWRENEQLKKELEDALLDVKIYKDANATFDNVYQENEKLKSRIEYLERKIERERNATNKQYEKWEKEALEKINKLEKENAFLTVEVEALRQIKPIRKLPQELTVLKLDDGDVK